MTNTLPLIKATLFRLDSIDFLLPYSLDPVIPQIPNPTPPLGDMRRIEPVRTLPETKIMMIRRACMIPDNNKKGKRLKIYIGILQINATDTTSRSKRLAT
jgi:hypothetical protein